MNNKVKSGIQSFTQNREKINSIGNQQILKPVNKIKRQPTKQPGIKYVRISATIPEITKEKLKVALYTTFKETHKTQDNLVNSAILSYINDFKDE